MDASERRNCASIDYSRRQRCAILAIHTSHMQGAGIPTNIYCPACYIVGLSGVLKIMSDQ